MFKLNYKKILALCLSSVIFLPMVIGAADTTIKNPLKSDSVDKILLDIMNLVATAGAIVVVFFIIYSGYKFVTARGDSGKLDDAKKTFYYTVIGGAILLGADIIANVVVNTVESTTGVKTLK